MYFTLIKFFFLFTPLSEIGLGTYESDSTSTYETLTRGHVLSVSVRHLFNFSSSPLPIILWSP